MRKVEHLVYGDRKVFTVSAFNRGVGMFLGRLPAVWVEGEVTELRRNEAWANVFLTLKDPTTGATLSVTIARRIYDRLDTPPRRRARPCTSPDAPSSTSRRASSACARRPWSASGSERTSSRSSS